MTVKHWVAVFLLVQLPIPAASFRRTSHSSTRHASALALRRRMFTSTLITEPGLGELDYSVTGSASTDTLFFPTTLKYTPEGPYIFWGRTEFSASWDSLYSADDGQNRNYHFSDHVNLTATSVLHNGEHWDFALAPQAIFLTRGASGARFGATGIARYDSGHNSFSTSASWTGATHPSDDNNPAGTFDWIMGYARNLGEHFTVYASAQLERSTGFDPQVAVFEGIEYSRSDRWAIDLSGQHYAIGTGQTDNQMVLGITITLGHLKKDEPPSTAPPGSSGGATRGR